MQELLNNTPEIAEEVMPTEAEPTENNNTQAVPNLITEFTELVKNPYYTDSVDHINEIIEYAQEHAVSLKTAYNSLFAESKYETLRQQAEQDTLTKLWSKQSRKIEALDGGSSLTKKSVNLSADQLETAEACNMTPEEYAKWM